MGALILGALTLQYGQSALARESAARAFDRSHYILPRDIRKNALSFAGVPIPLDRKEVRRRVTEQLNFLLMDRRAVMMEWFDRMSLYGPLIRGILRNEKVPEDMIYLAALLSDLLPNARNKSGGVGWWALGSLPEAKSPKVVQWVATNSWDDRRDFVLSTRIACTWFQWLHGRKTTDNWLLAISAFLDGTDKVQDVVSKAPRYSYWELVMPQRSEIMVPRLVALKIIDAHRDLYGVDVTSPPALSYDLFDKLKLRKDLPLHVVARWCGTNPRAIWELNPGVSPSTGVLPKPDKRSPSGFPLRVPKGMAGKVKNLLEKQGYL